MLPNCQLSCHNCKTDSNKPATRTSLCGTGNERNCCDKDPSCAQWASNGECSRNPEWMLSNCQLSCHNCKTDSNKPATRTSLCGTGKESNCCDKDRSCAQWASYGECDKNPKFMLSKCKLSCNACRTTFPKPRAQTCRNNGMTDEVRKKFLDMHNNYRSMVAKGEAKDGAGGYAPRAARMKKMVCLMSLSNARVN
ncbi:shTK domain protein [Ancylostoma caninum]|uniref:ShTK domain protein n=1 Tax=Ancylostoma caninum TaxID=29170 RepID=A0A368FGC6_ANCCA|nr:shTK domain protein [Ancylostoma caninum]